MQLIRKYPVIGLIFACACLTVATLATMGGIRGAFRTAPPARPAYFIDLNTNKVFVASADTSPVRAPSGRLPDGSDAGFRAYIYTCGRVFDARGMTVEQIEAKGGGVAYISMYTTESQEAQVELRETAFSDEDQRLYELMDIIRNGHLMRSLDSKEWFQADSHGAYELEMSPQERCDGGRPTQLHPQR